MDPTFPVFPVFSLVGFFLVIIPLPWHLQALNSGTCLFMAWTAIGCIIQFVNSIAWHNSIIDKAPLWCDITTRLTVGISVAIPAASLCINRRLYKIATCQVASITHDEKKRTIFVDLSIGLGIPVVQMALQFVVQGHRYDIWEDLGCLPTTVNTPPAYPLSFLWPNVISLISGAYCILTLREFMLKRAQFTQFLSSRTTLTVNRYFRLMCLATTDILFTIPLSSYGVYLNAVITPIYPWKSWDDTHFDWYTLDVYPAVSWRSNRMFTIALELNRWSVVFCALVFFAFFGFSDEAMKIYRKLYWRSTSFARSQGKAASPWVKTSTLPRYAPQECLDTPITSVIHKHVLASASQDSFHSSTPTAHTSPKTHCIKMLQFDVQSLEGDLNRLSTSTV